jgi:hypothetical protein
VDQIKISHTGREEREEERREKKRGEKQIPHTGLLARGAAPALLYAACADAMILYAICADAGGRLRMRAIWASSLQVCAS